MKYLLYVMLFVLVATSTLASSGLGMSPSIIQQENLVRGNSYTKFVKVVNLDEVDQTVSMELSGDGAEWVTIIDTDTNQPVAEVFGVTATEQKTFAFQLDIPEDAANGFYQGRIQIQPSAQKPGETVSLIVRTVYQFSVTGTEVKGGVVNSMVTQDTEAGQPLRIQYDFENTGNIRIAPTAEVTISKDGTVVDTFTELGIEVQKGLQKVQTLEWDTENRGTGLFTAEVTISLEGEEIATQTLPFSVEAGGTFEAEVLTGKPEAPSVWEEDKLQKVTVQFHNIGKVDVMAKASSEVLLDGELQDVVASEQLNVKAGASETLTLYYKPSSPGKYELHSKVLYNGEESAIDPLTFEVKSDEALEVNRDEFKESSFPMILIIVLVVLIAAGVIAFIFLKK
jgi:hypothetical protein